jgi:GxxExxY protein
MQTDEETINRLTEAIIGCAFKVANELGSGFLEKIYENAMAIELRNAGLSVIQQYPIPVRYQGHLVGEYACDLLVEDTVLVELKAVRNFDDAHTAQCLHYLSATAVSICLLINFGKRVEVKRFRGKNNASSLI